MNVMNVIKKALVGELDHLRNKKLLDEIEQEEAKQAGEDPNRILSPAEKKRKKDERWERLRGMNIAAAQQREAEAEAEEAEKALHVAAWGGDLEVVKYLVGRGASVTATNNRGATAKDIASSRGHTAVVEYLESVGG